MFSFCIHFCDQDFIFFFRWPWLLIISLLGLIVNFIDILIKFKFDSHIHDTIDYIWCVFWSCSTIWFWFLSINTLSSVWFSGWVSWAFVIWHHFSHEANSLKRASIAMQLCAPCWLHVLSRSSSDSLHWIIMLFANWIAFLCANCDHQGGVRVAVVSSQQYQASTEADPIAQTLLRFLREIERSAEDLQVTIPTAECPKYKLSLSDMFWPVCLVLSDESSQFSWSSTTNECVCPQHRCCSRATWFNTCQWPDDIQVSQTSSEGEFDSASHHRWQVSRK